MPLAVRWILLAGVDISPTNFCFGFGFDTPMDSLVAPIFRLSDLVYLHTARLEQLGIDVAGRVHSTDLKKRVLAYFPDMEAHKQGRDVVLISNEDVEPALRKACEHDADGDAVHLVRAASIVRRDMFKMKNQFGGSFEPNNQEDSVPLSLLALVARVLNGPNIRAQSNSSTMSQRSRFPSY
ncbi:hypothetical protein HOLleu_03392 [Holothuria leucospilota]|uniref:Uncharacterized protein n=1 Tax=Holothuria leucospilota TaxID=206669 RepID=A0A9Q1CSS7_HOLLE|nr:hypothetical protein HOLleu_03392 [Holothuria leucospilota]